ncbi:carboxypeptidase-like regulatory domain-containing protein [Sedimentibacter sp.]|uniref:carboxypeptidase-like regulatory domain-containing protein n=1 Tax=Sedimentibacter sp. TaxID=1960295 RepID=UPI0028AACD18|nr:carboxypeptidase-like regulatory domain-containing protein [Sedimentibacter sp.]
MNANNIKPYKVKNMISKKLEIPTQPEEGSVGYISTVVYTASGALPVPDAIITVYNINEAGEENILFHLVTDRSGNSPLITLPVMRGEREYEFTTYNIRVQAIGYYTTNVLDVRVFPDVTTTYRINLIPTAQGTDKENGQTVIIPPIPLDITN